MNAQATGGHHNRTTTITKAHFQGDTPNANEDVVEQSRRVLVGSSEYARERGPLKFFLVEDNVIIRENLAETLQEMVGAEVVGNSDAQSEATQWLCDPSHEWDVAVIDIFLKRGNGVKVVAALQGFKRQQKIIVLSNYASPDIRKECLRLGADAVFDKSTELDDLIAFCAKVQTH